MTIHGFNFAVVDASWRHCLEQGLTCMDSAYLKELTHSNTWLPGKDHLFSAFSLPMDQVNYVLFGESPYPRRESANGYAFWDATVNELWSPTGLSKKVNRATSLRNILKMLLIAEGMLSPQDTGQEAIAIINKQTLVQTNQAFFTNLLQHGFLLLNASLVLHRQHPKDDAKAWLPFITQVLHGLLQKRPQIKLILLGRIAKEIDKIIINHPEVEKIYAEHPYNLSFITRPAILDFFRPLHLLYNG